MKLLYPARSLGTLVILAGFAGPALAAAPNSAHSVMQLGQRHVNCVGVKTAQDMGEHTSQVATATVEAHSMPQSGERHVNTATYSG